VPAIGVPKHWVIKMVSRGPILEIAANIEISPNPNPIAPLNKNHGNASPPNPAPKPWAHAPKNTIARTIRDAFAAGPPKNWTDREAKRTETENKNVAKRAGSMNPRGEKTL
jgi:hypothetical protein